MHRRARSCFIRTYITEEEYARIKALAEQAGLSLSAFIRASALNHPVRSVLDLEAVGELMKVAGNLGRAAGLLKLYLSGGNQDRAQRDKVNSMIEDMRALQKELHTIAGRVVMAKKIVEKEKKQKGGEEKCVPSP